MSVRLKLLVIVLFVALVPLGISAYTSFGIHQRALERNVASLHQAAASQQAQRLDSRLKNLEDNLQRLVQSTLPWSELSFDERQAALWLIYRADEDIVAVVLLDSANNVSGAPAYLAHANASEEPSHLPVSARIVSDLRERLGHLPQMSGELGVGAAFSVAGVEAPILPLQLSVPRQDVGQTALHLAVGFSLRSICRAEPQTGDLEILIVDATGRSACRSTRSAQLEPVAELMGQLHEPRSSIHRYRDPRGRDLLSASAPLRYGWRVFAEQPVSIAFAASHHLRQRAWLWIGLSAAIALISGLLLARSISVPVHDLMAGVDELTRGNLQHRLEMAGSDEFSRLAAAFNRLAVELTAREAEIRGWNAELQQKVEERTRDIARYHAHLVQAEKASVIARLSAGVACEINDPLTGILGAVQLLAARARQTSDRGEESKLLANAIDAAQRIRELIKRVQTLGQRQPRSQLRPVAVGDLVDSASELVAPAMAAANIELIRNAGELTPAVLGNFTQLEQALLQVLSNAINACVAATTVVTPTDSNEQAVAHEPQLHQIVICTRWEADDMVRITVSDDGVGISPEALESIFEPFVTLRSDSGTGLGLTIARRIIEEHGGTIWAERNEVAGTLIHVMLRSVRSIAEAPSANERAPLGDV